MGRMARCYQLPLTAAVFIIFANLCAGKDWNSYQLTVPRPRGEGVHLTLIAHTVGGEIEGETLLVSHRQFGVKTRQRFHTTSKNKTTVRAEGIDHSLHVQSPVSNVVGSIEVQSHLSPAFTLSDVYRPLLDQCLGTKYITAPLDSNAGRGFIANFCRVYYCKSRYHSIRGRKREARNGVYNDKLLKMYRKNAARSTGVQKPDLLQHNVHTRTLHQGALVFTKRGRQCISKSVAALVYHLNKSISTWETHDLDHILDQGDNLHSILFGHLNEDYPLVNSLPKQLTVCDYQVDLQMTNSFTGLLEAMNDDPPYFSIETAVLNVNNFAILILGSCTPEISSAIVKIYIFDPHSRDSAGMGSPDGTTVRTSYVSVAEVKQYLLSLATSLELSSCPFELTLVDLQVKEPVYHNLQPVVPSRFEESSDSDVPLARQRLGLGFLSQTQMTYLSWRFKEKVM
ncbi:ATP-dependent DNA helicase [Plakobranchus ocellatus]|uniref:ATP-dependent DNA helicase n=1 Tax=Plakobranchus ocellatus TaxID=259542 RepID=A0AAV4CPG9_9GAST|nr:ATP-dependent DNA helicase [Plakobranchus ocellatus]